MKEKPMFWPNKWWELSLEYCYSAVNCKAIGKTKRYALIREACLSLTVSNWDEYNFHELLM